MKSVLMSVVVLLSFSEAHAWWSPNEGIRVNCQSYDSAGAVVTEIRVEGYTVKISTAGQAQAFQARIYQTNNSKVWEHPKFDLHVALQQSSWGGSGHAGTLIEKSNGALKDTILWCVPEIQN